MFQRSLESTFITKKSNGISEIHNDFIANIRYIFNFQISNLLKLYEHFPTGETSAAEYWTQHLYSINQYRTEYWASHVHSINQYHTG